MLFVPSLTRGWFLYDNFGANPSLTPGTSVVPGASDVEGAWTQVASAADIAQDVYGFFIRVSNGGSVSQSKPHLLDVGVDPAGGTAYAAIINNVVCGGSAAMGTGIGLLFFFPFYIKAGSSVAVRIQGGHATAGTVRVGIRLYGQLSQPVVMPVGSFSETIGAITGSDGVTYTPGNAADGAWVSLGTTARALWWWQIGMQRSDATGGNQTLYTEISYGDATNKHIIARIMTRGDNGEEIYHVLPFHLYFFEAYCPVPAGAELWIRGRCETAPDTGYNGVAIGIGG